MFGNVTGWVISLLLVVIVAAAISQIDARIRPTPPDAFGLSRENAAPLTLWHARAAVPADGAAPPIGIRGESRDLYRSALAVCREREAAYLAYARGGAFSETETVRPGIELLVAAAAEGPGFIFRGFEGELINYDNVQPPLQSLELLGRAGLRAAEVAPDPQDARRTLLAVFTLGYSLFQERLTYAELDLGLRLMAESLALLVPVTAKLRPPLELENQREFDAARLKLAREQVLPIAGRIRTLDPAVVAANAGNQREWAKREDVDRVWRIESILALGRQKYFVGLAVTPGDAKAADRLLKALEADNDPTIAQAARTARGLSAEAFRVLR